MDSPSALAATSPMPPQDEPLDTMGSELEGTEQHDSRPTTVELPSQEEVAKGDVANESSENGINTPDDPAQEKENETLSASEKSDTEPHCKADEDAITTGKEDMSTNHQVVSHAATDHHPEETAKSSPAIFSMPMDSLHSIASFLTPTEWCGFGQLNHTSHRIHREIIRRVRMHGFKCATEIVTAWKLGQHEDAKELAALYVSAGVPVYPKSLGHSYHTLVWRMSVEAKETQGQEASADPPVETSASRIDRFYSNRADFRSRSGYSPEISYLEEKSLYWMDEKASETDESTSRLPAFGPNHRRAPSPAGEFFSSGNNGDPSNALNVVGPAMAQDSSGHGSKIPMKIHQHLLDQHMRGQHYVDDQEGALATPPVSLSADFFHPSARSRSNQSRSIRFAAARNVEDEPGILLFPEDVLEEQNESIPDVAPEPAAEQGPEEEPRPDDGIAPDEPPAVAADALAPEDLLEEEEEEDSTEGGEAIPLEPPPPLPSFRFGSVLNCVDLEVYSSSMTAAEKTEGIDDWHEMNRHMRSRFATYTRRLEAFIAHGDSSGFEESMLDFWDEFFPHTAGIQYYDRQTAVPRISCLQKFLTKPCPKSIGIMQCEIERIKISTRGKGMKGRFFPTYEYRLFIRNRAHSAMQESANTEPDDFVRRDTVLMIAKNRGRKHAEASGVAPMSAAAKKGSNNYYLYMPQQMDVDAHFNKVNEGREPAKLNPNGASHDPVLKSNDAGSVLLGRLQSNFIGTEFQIFTPRVRKRGPRKPDSGYMYSPSDDDLDYDSGMSSDNNSTRRSRFGRLSLRRSNLANADLPTINGSSDTLSTRSRGSRGVKRVDSCPELPQGRQTRTNRRAIANESESQQLAPLLYEEEDGVITYTANLLGSRPRIMDVCIPKVSPDGMAGAEWKQYLESSDDTDDCRMLSCFRQLQQRMENQDQNAPADDEADQEDGSDGDETETPEDFGLLALQNRPPWWNVELGSFVLNFGGRVSVASVKNFQLCDRHDQDRIMLQFGRIQGRHSFTMDFQHPLTAVQAFSIAISSLQSKISFG